MNDTKCFAYIGGECIVVCGRRCRGSNKCAFYKTVEEHKQSSAAAFARIARLPFADQRFISENYYGGFFPWVSGVKA